MKKILAMVLLMAVSFSGVPAWAGEGTAGDYFTDMGKQLGRGVRDVVTSPAEIPCTMNTEIKSRGAGAGIFTGLGLGLVYMVKRIVIGVCDIGTFLIPRSEPAQPVVCSKPQASA